MIGPEILGDIIASVADIALVISEDGAILSVLVDPSEKELSGLHHWEGQNLRALLTSESIPKFDNRLEDFLGQQGPIRSVELNHSDDRRDWEFPVRYSFHRIGPEGAILMLGRDLRPIAELQQQLVKAQLALEMDYEAQRDAETRHRALMETTREAIVFVTVPAGRIIDANPAASKRLGLSRDALREASFIQQFEDSRRAVLMDELTSAALSDTPRSVSVKTAKQGGELVLVPRVFRASGERLILCRIEDPKLLGGGADPVAEHTMSLYEDGAEAIVFCDKSGNILAANDAFLGLTDIAHGLSVKGRSLSEFLARGSVDLRVLLENTQRTGKMKMYATKLTGAFDAERPVEISASVLGENGHPVIGLVVRDAARIDAVRVPQRGAADTNTRSVMELLGSATLKEIVADTTDVVEKMCIEAAVELTGNNRVAAAEMLGLSRQSLYVKLRKYGLLRKDGDR
ncbi:transcriptional regulator PpsR [Aestuariibius sp. 2305UL40-4]|uniref:transcriptional regulator PpsR n=1 Tax=Aestuariibius violaceus TaxID=3234132 RepID=UPI00348F4C6B